MMGNFKRPSCPPSNSMCRPLPAGTRHSKSQAGSSSTHARGDASPCAAACTCDDACIHVLAHAAAGSVICAATCRTSRLLPLHATAAVVASPPAVAAPHADMLRSVHMQRMRIGGRHGWRRLGYRPPCTRRVSPCPCSVWDSPRAMRNRASCSCRERPQRTCTLYDLCTHAASPAGRSRGCREGCSVPRDSPAHPHSPSQPWSIQALPGTLRLGEGPLSSGAHRLTQLAVPGSMSS